MIRFDHIAIGCDTLSDGAVYMAERAGLIVPVGGEHPLMGTHNLVMSTGPDTFFEAISINPNAPSPVHPRWFGLDTAKFKRPRPYAWILNSDNLDHDLEVAKSLGIDLGVPTKQTRGAMTWQFAVRPDGEIPLEGAAPMLMAWPEMPAHPAANMPDLGARISGINLATPYADRINKLLKVLGTGDLPITVVKAPTLKFTVTLTLADGREVLLD